LFKKAIIEDGLFGWQLSKCVEEGQKLTDQISQASNNCLELESKKAASGRLQSRH